MQNPFPDADIDKSMNPFAEAVDIEMPTSPRTDLRPIQPTYLPWEEAAYRIISNIPRDTLNVAKEGLMLIRPVGKQTQSKVKIPESVPVVGGWTAFPGLQDLAILVGIEAPKAGFEKITGVQTDTPMVDGLLQFYKENYGMGPEGIKGFERFITEHPVEFMTDLMMFASFGTAVPAKAAKTGARASAISKTLRAGEGFRKAYEAGKVAVAYENFSPFVVKLDKVMNEGFALPTRFANMVESVPGVRRFVHDVPVSFGERAGEIGRGYRMGLTEVADPAAHAMRGLIGTAKRVLPKPGKAKDAAGSAQRLGVKIPLSAEVRTQLGASLEALDFKRDGETANLVEQLDEDLNRIAEETVSHIYSASDMETAGDLGARGYEQFVREFQQKMRGLYDSIEGLNDLPAVLAHTWEFFRKFREDAAEAEPLTGKLEFSSTLHRIDENVGKYVEDDPSIAEGAAPGGVPPPGSDGAAPVSGTASVADTAKYGSRDRMIKGNWGKKYQGRYELVDLQDLEASHLPDGTPNPNYDQSLQPRDRSDRASQQQVKDIARSLDPELLLDDTSSMNDGAPIIGSTDNLVESGNGRVAGMVLASQEAKYQGGLKRYKEELLANLGKYGLEASDAEEMAWPVLVRRRTTEVPDRRLFTQEANDNSGKADRSAEIAARDAKLMSREVLQRFSFGEENSLRDALRTSRNNEFINSFISKFPADKQSLFYDKAGKQVSDEGYARIERAMLTSVFEGEFGAMLAGKFADVSEPGLINIKKAVYAALPRLTSLKYLVEAGERSADFAIEEDLARAILKIEELSRTDTPAEHAKLQGSLFQGTDLDALPDNVARLLLIVERGKQAPSELTEFIRWYADQVEAQPSSHQGMLLEDIQPVTKAELLQTALGRTFDEIPEISELREQARASQEVPDGEDIPGGERVGRGLDETRQGQLEPLIWRAVRRTRTVIGDLLFSKHLDPIISREERFYKQLYNALTQDLDEAVAKHAPDRAGEFERVSKAYAQGRKKINEGWGLKILRLIQRGEEEKLVRAAFKQDTPLKQIPLIYELVGGKDSDAGKAMQAAFVYDLLESVRNEEGGWTTSGLHRRMKRYGDARLRAFLEGATVDKLHDVSTTLVGMSDFARMSRGSQTAFLLSADMGGRLGGALRELAYASAAGMHGIFYLIAAMVGQEALMEFFLSPMGQDFIKKGGWGRPVGRSVEALTRGASGQLGRRLMRSEEKRHKE